MKMMTMISGEQLDVDRRSHERTSEREGSGLRHRSAVNHIDHHHHHKDGDDDDDDHGDDDDDDYDGNDGDDEY